VCVSANFCQNVKIRFSDTQSQGFEMKIVRRKRAVSGIISGLFLVAASMMLFGAFYWQYVAQDHYNQIVLARLNREWERLNERLLISEVQTGTATLRFNVTNYGSVSANVTDLYLTNKSATPVWQKRYSLSIWINPGTKIYLNTNVSMTSGASYQFRIATQRGNTFAPTEGTIINQLQPGAGQNVPFTLWFVPESFQYVTTGLTWSTARPAWYMQLAKGSYVVFRLNVTNTYPSSVLVMSGCTMLIVAPNDQGNLNSEYKIYIVEEGSTAGAVVRFPSAGIWIPARSSKYLYYTASSENGTDTLRLITSQADKNYLNFVGLFYKVQGDPTNTIFGANVAVIAMQIKTT